MSNTAIIILHLHFPFLQLGCLVSQWQKHVRPHWKKSKFLITLSTYIIRAHCNNSDGYISYVGHSQNLTILVQMYNQLEMATLFKWSPRNTILITEKCKHFFLGTFDSIFVKGKIFMGRATYAMVAFIFTN